MNIEEMVRKQLIEIGADGLVNPDEECSCGLEALMPCGGDFTRLDLVNCKAARRAPVPEEFRGECDTWFIPLGEEA